MPRVCFQLQVRPDRLDEYRTRHSPVSAQMLSEIAASGRSNYSLFVRPDGMLIGYYETENAAASDAYLAASPIAAAWEAEMAPYFDALDGRADQGALLLEEVFNLDDQLTTTTATAIATASAARQDNS
jgi:L-rhamnose mutarotase